jgi:LysM repeat protein
MSEKEILTLNQNKNSMLDELLFTSSCMQSPKEEELPQEEIFTYEIEEYRSPLKKEEQSKIFHFYRIKKEDNLEKILTQFKNSLGEYQRLNPHINFQENQIIILKHYD